MAKSQSTSKASFLAQQKQLAQSGETRLVSKEDQQEMRRIQWSLEASINIMFETKAYAKAAELICPTVERLKAILDKYDFEL